MTVIEILTAIDILTTILMLAACCRLAGVNHLFVGFANLDLALPFFSCGHRRDTLEMRIFSRNTR